MNKKTLIIIGAVVLVLVGSFFAYKMLYKKSAVAPSKDLKNEKAISAPKKELDLASVKNLEKLKADMKSSKQQEPEKVVKFFDNDKKEAFVQYLIKGSNAVAKFDGQKWVFISSFNGYPDCSLLDKSGVPYKISTIDLACAINGEIRANKNPADKKAYEEFSR